LVKINIKSLIFAIVLGIAAWFWAFIIVGSAYTDPMGNPKPFVFEYYITMLIINAIISIIIVAIYIWKYEQKNPIIPDKWALDAIVFGAILCAMNFLLDIVFFGFMLKMDLFAYFWLESTAGYFYPLIILETFLIAFLIYGRKKE